MELNDLLKGVSSKTLLKPLKEALLSGLVALISLVISISAAGLIFSGSLQNHLLSGIGLILVSTMVTSTILSLACSFPQAVASPQDTFIVILSLSGVSIAHELQKINADHQIYPTMLAAAFISSISLGLLLFIIGFFKLGKYARFIPYQVLAGFFAGTGILMMDQSWAIMAGEGFHLKHIDQYLTFSMIQLWLPAIGLGLFLFISWKTFAKPLLIPPIIVGTTLIFYALLFFSGSSIENALDEGFLLGPFEEQEMWHLPDFSFFHDINWTVLGKQKGNFFAMLVLAPVNLLLNIAVIESSTGAEMNLDDEIKFVGFSNILSPFLGGSVVTGHEMGQSVFNYRLGNRSRFAGPMIALIFFIFILNGNQYIALFPKFIIGGVIFYLGFELMSTWVLESRHQHFFLEYVVILFIASWIVIQGFLQGVILGLLISLGVFVFSYSKMAVIKQFFSGSYFHSNVERGEWARDLLQKYGDAIHIANLQGFLFFGNAHWIVEHVKNSTHLNTKYLIIDFTDVSGVDSSSVHSFAKLLTFVQKNQIELIFTNVREELGQKLSGHFPPGTLEKLMVHFPTTDYALEWCEDRLIAEKKKITRTVEIPLVPFEFGEFIPDEETRTKLFSYIEKVTVEKNDVIVEENTEATSIYFLVEGQADVVIGAQNGTEGVRLRSIGPGAVFGEVALILNKKRTASVIAKEKCSLYKVRKDSFKKMEEEDPIIAISFQKIMMKQLASRLLYSNLQISGILDSIHGS